MKTRQFIYILLIMVVYMLPLFSKAGASDVVKIMLIGDSITKGEYDSAEGGIRKELNQRLTASGYNFDFVGGYGTAPLEGHFRDQRKIDDFFPSSLLVGHSCDMDVTEPMNIYKPNLVAIHLGTNSVNVQNKNSTPYEKNGVIQNTHAGEMYTLVNYLLKWHNGDFGTHLNYIVVSLIAPVKDTTTNFTKASGIELNMEINRMVFDFQSGKLTGRAEPVYVCDQFSRLQENPHLWSTLSSNPMYDNLHPKKNSLYKMGDNYYNIISYLLSGEQKWFKEMTWEANVAGYQDIYFAYKGIAIADITGDGRDDIYITRSSTVAPGARDYFYKSSTALPFTESATTYHINDANQSWGAVFLDIDNDGDYDLFNGNTSARNRLYRNLNNANFEEITSTAGIANVSRNTTAVLAFDCENDGDMDLFALNSETPNEFYLNNGTGVFTLATRGLEDVTEAGKYSMGASAADFDNDGDVDVLAVKRNTKNKLWINNGSGTFTDGATAAGAVVDFTKYYPNGVNWADFDNDGDLDLIISALGASNVTNPLLQIFKNTGSGVFQNIASQVNITMSGYTVLVGDFNNDGYQDIITTSDLGTSALYLNKGNWVFEKQTDTGSEIYAGDIRGGAVFDYDNDGDLDFLVTRTDAFNVFMRNNLNNGYHYLRVKAVGSNNNAGGYGTKIWVYEAGYAGNNSHLLGYREVVSGTGHISQYSPIQHFGLGAHTSCDVRVRLTNGTEYNYTLINANSLLVTDGQVAMDAPQITGDAINGQRHITITWSIVNGATGYNVYRGTTATFTPDLNGGSNRVATAVTDSDAWTTGVQWTDNSVTTGIAGNNYFYVVTPVNNTREGPMSKVFGQFNYDLVTTTSTDFNEIAIALHSNNITSAAELMTTIPNCNSVAKWSATTQGYDQYIPGLDFTNFAVLDGYPYYVNVTANNVYTQTGTVTNPTFTLVTTASTDFNEVMLPLDKTSITTSEALMNNIPYCNSVALWSAANQGYTQYIPGLDFTNFATVPGYPYYVNVTQGTTWPVSGLLKSSNAISGTPVSTLPNCAPHAVYGRFSSNNHITGFIARIIGQDGDILDCKSPGCKIVEKDFVVQAGSFKQGWKPGDIMDIEFKTANGTVVGKTQIVLTAEAFDRCADIQTEADVVPAAFRLLQNYPNPFNPETTIEYELPVEGHVTLDVFNTSGQHIRTLVSSKKPAGMYKVIWNGKDDSGLNVSSGTYFYILRCGNIEKKMKAILIH